MPTTRLLVQGSKEDFSWKVPLHLRTGGPNGAGAAVRITPGPFGQPWAAPWLSHLALGAADPVSGYGERESRQGVGIFLENRTIQVSLS